jgi:hypothetical protein
MADITVAYHADGYGPARPAVNVKVHGWSLAAKLYTILDNDDAERLYRLAEERVYSDFWQAAEENATQRGLGAITQEGRSGGWLVFTEGPSSEAMTAPGASKRLIREWVEQYAAFAAWCAAEVAAAPERAARLAQDMAMDEVGRQSVALAPILHALGLNRAVLT